MWYYKNELISEAPTGQCFCMRVDEMVTEMCEAFADKYFWEDAEMFMVWENNVWLFPWPLFVNDYYFSLDDVYTAMWYDIPEDCLFQYMDYQEEVMYEWAVDYNLKSFYSLKYNNERCESSEKESCCKSGKSTSPRTTTSSVKCWSVKCSYADDTDDAATGRYDEDDGWEDEEVGGADSSYYYRHHCKCRARSCRCDKWRQCC